MELGAAPIWRKQQNTSNHIAMKYKAQQCAIATLATTVRYSNVQLFATNERYSNCNKCEIQQCATLCNICEIQQWRWLPTLPIELVMAISCFAGLAMPTPPVLRSLVYFCQGGRTYTQTHMKSSMHNEKDDLTYRVSFKRQCNQHLFKCLRIKIVRRCTCVTCPFCRQPLWQCCGTNDQAKSLTFSKAINHNKKYCFVSPLVANAKVLLWIFLVSYFTEQREMHRIQSTLSSCVFQPERCRRDGETTKIGK